MIYDYVCDNCQAQWRRSCRLRDYEKEPRPPCSQCGTPGRQLIFAPRLLHKTGEFKAFKSPVDGTLITSEQALREHNKRNGVQNLHDGYDEAGVQRLMQRDYNAEMDAERAKDLKDDMKQAVARLEDGYTPPPAAPIEE